MKKGNGRLEYWTLYILRSVFLVTLSGMCLSEPLRSYQNDITTQPVAVRCSIHNMRPIHPQDQVHDPEALKLEQSVEAHASRL